MIGSDPHMRFGWEHIMSRTRILSLFVLAMLAGASCRDPIQPPPPPAHVPTIVLSVEGVAVTEAYLRVHFTDTAGVKMYKLFRGAELVSSGATRFVDTVVSDTTVLRAHSYMYRAYRYRPLDSVLIDSSSAVAARTLDTAGVSVTPVDVGVTDAYVQLTMNDRNPIRGFVLKRDGGAILTGNLTGRDTVIYDTGLTQAHPCSYKIFRTYNGSTIDSSIPAVATTLDTTTHNFTWEVDTLGYLTSSLFDVAIVNDNDFWVVGSIYGKDSADYHDNHTPYGGAEWTPAGWSYRKFYISEPRPGGGTVQLPVFDNRSILYFNENDFWLDCFYHWNGIKLTSYSTQIGPLLDSNDAPRRVMGSSSNNVWIYGGGGAVFHYDGMSWQKVPSGIESELSDACESPDGKTVWFCGWKDFQPTSLLRYRDGRMETIYNSADRAYEGDPNRITGATMSVWTNSNYRIFPLTWYALFRAFANTGGEGKAIPISGVNAYWSYQRVRANGVNDIVVVGNGAIWHYNGKTWRAFSEIWNQLDILYAVAIRGNLIVAVGIRTYDGVHYYGVVYKGRRN